MATTVLNLNNNEEIIKGGDYRQKTNTRSQQKAQTETIRYQPSYPGKLINKIFTACLLANHLNASPPWAPFVISALRTTLHALIHPTFLFMPHLLPKSTCLGPTFPLALGAALAQPFRISPYPGLQAHPHILILFAFLSSPTRPGRYGAHCLICHDALSIGSNHSAPTVVGRNPLLIIITPVVINQLNCLNSRRAPFFQ